MARPPLTDAELIDRYGPHLNQAPPGGWNAGIEVDRVVDTHCCFCGQQCGIKLKVHDNEVVGFEPWYDFPFNEGKLCPKGVKRYLQGSHPDRVTYPMERDETAPGGFRRVSWDHALDRVVSEIRRIQAAYGPDSFAMLSGVSLTNEKSYLIGKFARLALHTANLDYNGRYCMVSAGAGNKKALGIDRASNPWSDIPLADVVWTAGTNIAETFPITTSYIWKARDRGARLIVQDPRVVPHARTADLFLPVRPGTDSALFGAVLHELIRHDWLDHDFIDAHTNDFDQATDPRVLEAAGVERAVRMFVAVADGFEGGGVVDKARKANPGLEIVARAHSDAEAVHLIAHGADRVVMGDEQIARGMLEPEGLIEGAPSEAGAELAPTGPRLLILDDAERAVLAVLRELDIWPGEAMSRQPIREAAVARGFQGERLDAAFMSLREKDCVRDLGDERITVTKQGFLAGLQPA